MASGPLRLKAHDVKDLTVLSAMLQDAVVKPADMTFLPSARRFAVTFNRFRWEEKDGVAERVRTGLRLETVSGVKTRNWQGGPETVLSLLSLLPQEHDRGVRLLLVFSGEASILIEADGIDAYLEDITEPWAATGRPHHDPTEG